MNPKPACYPKHRSYRPVVEKLLQGAKEKEEEQPKPAVSTVTTELPTLASPIQPKAGDIVMRTSLSDGGRLTKLKRGQEILYHLKVPDGRQIYLEKKPDSLGLLITDKKGQPVMTMGCDL